jgi:hypothetical protein
LHTVAAGTAVVCGGETGPGAVVAVPDEIDRQHTADDEKMKLKNATDTITIVITMNMTLERFGFNASFRSAIYMYI